MVNLEDDDAQVPDNYCEKIDTTDVLETLLSSDEIIQIKPTKKKRKLEKSVEDGNQKKKVKNVNKKTVNNTELSTDDVIIVENPKKERKKPKASNGTRKKRKTKDDKITARSSAKKPSSQRPTTKDRSLQWIEYYCNNKFGIFIECTKCLKWRKVFDYEEDYEVPEEWDCSMSLAEPIRCEDPEENYEKTEFLNVDFVPGSIVWAKLETYPWWPAMIEDDPDIEEYYWNEDNGILYYHVTFLDDNVSRAWIPSSLVCPYVKPPKNIKYSKKDKRKYADLLEKAKGKAKSAISMSIKERLQKFSFVINYHGRFPKAHNYEEEDSSDLDLTQELLREVDEIESLKSFDSEDDVDEMQDGKGNESKTENMVENKRDEELLSDFEEFRSLSPDVSDNEARSNVRVNVPSITSENKPGVKNIQSPLSTDDYDEFKSLSPDSRVDVSPVTIKNKPGVKSIQSPVSTDDYDEFKSLSPDSKPDVPSIIMKNKSDAKNIQSPISTDDYDEFRSLSPHSVDNYMEQNDFNAKQNQNDSTETAVNKDYTSDLKENVSKGSNYYDTTVTKNTSNKKTIKPSEIKYKTPIKQNVKTNTETTNQTVKKSKKKKNAIDGTIKEKKFIKHEQASEKLIEDVYEQKGKMHYNYNTKPKSEQPKEKNYKSSHEQNITPVQKELKQKPNYDLQHAKHKNKIIEEQKSLPTENATIALPTKEVISTDKNLNKQNKEIKDQITNKNDQDSRKSKSNNNMEFAFKPVTKKVEHKIKNGKVNDIEKSSMHSLDNESLDNNTSENAIITLDSKHSQEMNVTEIEKTEGNSGTNKNKQNNLNAVKSEENETRNLKMSNSTKKKSTKRSSNDVTEYEQTSKKAKFDNEVSATTLINLNSPAMKRSNEMQNKSNKRKSKFKSIKVKDETSIDAQVENDTVKKEPKYGEIEIMEVEDEEQKYAKERISVPKDPRSNQSEDDEPLEID